MPSTSPELGAQLHRSGRCEIADNALELSVSQLPKQMFGYFLMSMTQDFLPFFGGSQGNLCLGGKIMRFNHVDGGILFSGDEMSFSPDLNDLPQNTVFQPGETWSFQPWFRDVGRDRDHVRPSNPVFFGSGLAGTWGQKRGRGRPAAPGAQGSYFLMRTNFPIEGTPFPFTRYRR